MEYLTEPPAYYDDDETEEEEDCPSMEDYEEYERDMWESDLKEAGLW